MSDAERREYVVCGTLHVGVFTRVMAETEQEAMEIAGARGVVSLCHRCGGSSAEALSKWSLSDGLDGEVDEFLADE
jgi:hypothetical protein